MPDMAKSAPIDTVTDSSTESEDESEDESGYESEEDFTSAKMELSMERRRKLHRGRDCPSFNGYQSLTSRQRRAIRNGIVEGVCNVFDPRRRIPRTWVDTIQAFLVDNITQADSHIMTVRKLVDFLKDQWCASDKDAPIISREVIRSTNMHLYELENPTTWTKVYFVGSSLSMQLRQ